MIIPRSYDRVHLHWNPGSEPSRFLARKISTEPVMDCHKNREVLSTEGETAVEALCFTIVVACMNAVPWSIFWNLKKEFGTFFWPRNLVKLRSFWWWNILLNASPKRRVSCWKACTSTGREISSYSSFNRPRRIYYGRSQMVWLCLSQFLLISFPE